MTRFDRVQMVGCDEAGAGTMLVTASVLDENDHDPVIVLTVADRSVSRSLSDFEGLRDLLQRYHRPHQKILLDKALSRCETTLNVAVRNWLRGILQREHVHTSDEFRAFIGADDTEADSDEFLTVSDLFESTTVGSAMPVGLKLRTTCLEDFEQIRVLGKGAFGKVVLARYKHSGKLYALKQIEKSLVLRKNQVAHTQTERDVLEYIRHPFIVKMHGAFESERKLFLVLDYCAGGELFFHLTKAGKFPEHQAKFYLSQLVLAIEYVHDLGIVFRDLKLENVLLDAAGNIVLTDFGLSAEGVYDNHSATAMCGTPEYLAPEVLNRTGCGRAVDWWALGMLLYEMLMGSPPFYSQNQSIMFTRILKGKLQIPHGVSSSAADLIKRLLNRDIDKRLGSKNDARDVKSHSFFNDIDWDQLYAKKTPPPFRPCEGKPPDDTSNFDPNFTCMAIQDDRQISRPVECVPEFQQYSFTAKEADL